MGEKEITSKEITSKEITPKEQTPKALLELIKDSGVVGAGGAGFPTYVKYNAKVDTLIINAAECEPLIDVDKLLIQNYFDKIYKGINIVANLIEAKRVVIALKSKYKKQIEVIKQFKANIKANKDVNTENSLNLEIFELENFYPAGDEQILVNLVTGKIVPEAGIPLMVGVVVSNVETILNVLNATEGFPVTDKFVTVGGLVLNPQTLKVPVGTPISVLLDYCKVDKSKAYKVLDGGPMMGKLIDENNYAVKKTTKSILVLPEDSIVMVQKLRTKQGQIKRAQAICLSCRMCTDLCPRYLLGHSLFPDELMKKLYKGTLYDEELEKFSFSYLCCDCGVCELYSCPVELSPRSLLNYIKEKLISLNIKNPHNRKDLNENEFIDFRRVPVPRLLSRIGLENFDVKTELNEFNYNLDFVKIYLSQHIGAKSIPIVNLGQKVFKGQIIAKIPESKIGSNIHSSINGIVKEITDDFIIIKNE